MAIMIFPSWFNKHPSASLCAIGESELLVLPPISRKAFAQKNRQGNFNDLDHFCLIGVWLYRFSWLLDRPKNITENQADLRIFYG
jgi:hypothetical protein